MPTYRPKRRTAPRQEKDALGRRLCRRCKAIVPKGRRSYCSPKCREEFEIAYFPQFTRRAVFKRDKGVCAKCGVDTELQLRIAHRLRRMGRSGWDAWMEFCRDLGIPQSFDQGLFWQADHIQECARGGWGLGLENFRTLCTPCHKAETARLVRELAEKRRAEKAPAAESLFDKEASPCGS